MFVEKILTKNGERYRYLLSNDNLKVEDKVFPIGKGRVNGNNFHFYEFDWNKYSSSFPDDPHTIINLHYLSGGKSFYKPYEVQTDKGWSPAESYFKILKKEKYINKIRETEHFTFDESYWEEIK